MNTITIQGSGYNFVEKTYELRSRHRRCYKVNKDMSFTVNLVRFIKEEQVVCLCLLKSLIISTDGKEINFNPRKRVGTYGAKEFDKSLKLMNYLKYKENIELINNISNYVNNRTCYIFIVESGRRIRRPDSTIKI